jgi:hypothetical protein
MAAAKNSPKIAGQNDGMANCMGGPFRRLALKWVSKRDDSWRIQ